MTTSTQKRDPVIWMNVTTSSTWNRPPVGIIRVEQALCSELSKILGPKKFKQCVWMDGQFIEWISKEKSQDTQIDKVVDIIFPSSKSFEISRKFLSRALGKFQKKTQGAGLSTRSELIEINLPLITTENFQPAAGDILISVGLDWDQPYTAEFFTLSTRKGIKVITCCYDLIPVLFPQYCVGDVARRFKEYFNMLTWGSSAVLCISEQTRRDYLNLCTQLGAPERPTCILPLGDNVPANIGDLSPEIKALIAEPFILFVSTIERRKNHEVLYRAYHSLCRAGHKNLLPKLVFVGMAGWGVGDLLKDIELDPLTQGLIVQLNHVNDGELGELYRNALFCVYPSLYEGWGLPVGEALAVGKAVLASNQGSLPEVGGNLVRYLDPWNSTIWAEAILELLTSPNVIKEMEQKVLENYSIRVWEDAAKSVTHLIDDLLVNSGSTELVLYPGYDFSTQVGIHVGSLLKSTGRGGYLMYGPHRSLKPGSYTVQVFDIPIQRTAGNLAIDFVGNGGTKCFWQGVFAISEADDDIEKLLFEFQLCIDVEVNDFEIRCIVGEANLALSRVLIKEEIIEVNTLIISSELRVFTPPA
jgi:glycosyltransferase involved in cell wall biosynthesis